MQQIEEPSETMLLGMQTLVLMVVLIVSTSLWGAAVGSIMALLR
jgi:hypothetical protein